MKGREWGGVAPVSAFRAQTNKQNLSGSLHQPAERAAHGGHFAGIQFYEDAIDTSKWPYRQPSPAGTSLAVEMARGVRWRSQHGSQAGGFAFVGTDPEFTDYSVEVDLADPDRLRPGRHYRRSGMHTYAQPGTIAMVEFDRGALRRTQPISPRHVQAVLREGAPDPEEAAQAASRWFGDSR